MKMRKFLVMTWIATGVPLAAAHAAESKVVVTLKPIHALVSEVMSGIGTPTLLVDGAASPHTFSLKPSQAIAISKADVFVRVSEQLEPFTRKIVAALPNTVRVVSLAEAPGIALLDQRRGATFDSHDHGHKHAGGHDHHDAHDADDADGADSAGKDGHIWLDTRNAEAIVDQVTTALIAAYPDATDKLTANAAALKIKLAALTTEIVSELAPVKGQPFIVFHDAIQYFEKRFDLPAAGSVTISPDVQPSAKRLTAVRRKIDTLGAVCVFSEPGFQPKLVAAVTDGTKARAGTLDPEGISLTAGPTLYFDLMRGMARNIKSCLAQR